MEDRLLFQFNQVKKALLDAKLKNDLLEVKRLETKLNLINEYYEKNK